MNLFLASRFVRSRLSIREDATSGDVLKFRSDDVRLQNVHDNISVNRRGISLLEVILAIAILGGAMAVILELVNLGMRSAVAARQRSEANLLCDTKMAELSSGILELKNYTAEQIAESEDWIFSATVQESSNLGLLVLTVAVEQANVENPVSVQIVRYVPDPEYDPTALEDLE